MVSITLTAAEECNQICYDIYAPICGSDGVNMKTFPNQCEMAVYNCNYPQSRKLSTLSQISHQISYTFWVTQAHNVVKTA